MTRAADRKAKSADLYRRIGRNVRAARIRLRLTQSALAAKVGLDNASISRLESGVQVPPVDRLDEIASALATSLPELVADTDHTDEMGNLLAGVFRELPLREKEIVYALALQCAQHWRARRSEPPR